ncbi:MAG TPA: AraC family transcriptional regulator [Nevskiaceae bacterium]|nr:AraC family transcriptional regulator [Nevskiaceae bacterium]
MPEAGKTSPDAETLAAPRVPDTLSLLLDDIHFEGVVLRQVELHAPWALHLHTPGLTAVHIVTRGRAVLERAGCAPLVVGTGDILVLPSGDAHDLHDVGTPKVASAIDLLPELGRVQPEPLHVGGGTGEATSLWSGHFRFDIDMARPLIRALPRLIHQRAIGSTPPAWLQHGLRFVAEETARPLPGQQAIFNHIADIVLVETLRDYVESLPEGAGNWLLALRDRALSTTLAAMHRNPAHDWSVPELAELANLSRSSFAERFTVVLGQPPLSYLTEHRMRLATHLLRHSRLSVAQVAERVGYGSETAFGQAFKRQYGLPPSQARNAED